MATSPTVRPATRADDDAVWRIIEPTFRAGETYPIPRDIIRADALAYWHSPGHAVFVAEADGEAVGTYYLRPNNRGGGSHVCNCGYIVAPTAMRQGVARAMCAHSLEYAKSRGFRAMQFNFVISSNDRAVRLWQDLGFTIVGRLPGASVRKHLFDLYLQPFPSHRVKAALYTKHKKNKEFAFGACRQRAGTGKGS